MASWLQCDDVLVTVEHPNCPMFPSWTNFTLTMNSFVKCTVVLASTGYPICYPVTKCNYTKRLQSDLDSTPARCRNHAVLNSWVVNTSTGVLLYFSVGVLRNIKLLNMVMPWPRDLLLCNLIVWLLLYPICCPCKLVLQSMVYTKQLNTLLGILRNALACFCAI